MSGQPKITIDMVHARATDNSFQRGKKYYQDGAIFKTVRRGDEIEGFCEGSQPEPYRVRASLSEDDIKQTSCTCEYAYGGDCKHIVALLLTYVHNPNRFEKQAPLEETLATHEKDELIAIIREMIERHPDLQSLVDRPSPSEQARHSPLDTSSIRNEIRYAVRSYDDWNDNKLERSLQSIVKTAQRFTAKQDWHSARAIYSAVLEECLQDNEYPVMDDEGSVSILKEILEHLGECVNYLKDDETERRKIFEKLLDAYIWDVNTDGYGLGDNVPDIILKHAQPSDLVLIRQRLKTAQGQAKDSTYSRWEVEAYETFLIQLDTLDNVDPEAILKRLYDEKLFSLLVAKLLEIKRVEEAVEIIEKQIISPFDRLHELQQLSAAGWDEAAIRLAEGTLKNSYDEHLVNWLLGRLYTRQDKAAYFKWQLRRMKKQPAVHHYRELKEAAEPIGNWDDVRWELISLLEKERKHDVLTRIYLEDEEWDSAWSALARVRQSQSDNLYLGGSLEKEVAQKARHARPEKALPIYIRDARREIEYRNRGSYAQAASYLVIIRELYTQLEDMASWNKLIGEVKEQYKNLPALQDELRKAKL